MVLSYGCQYQGGFLYSVDDTTNNGVTGTCTTAPCTNSIGGKVVSLVDQAARYPNGIVWSSNGGNSGVGFVDVSSDTLPGIDETSISSAGSPTFSVFDSFFTNTYTNPNPFTPVSFSMCDGGLDGSCNTNNIVTFYNQFITNNTSGNGGSPPFTAFAGPTNSTYYAAGLCKQVIEGYFDWYLPAICEMGYDGDFSGTDCGTMITPALQNMQLSLIDLSGFSSLEGPYWSSTEYSLDPQRGARLQVFAFRSSRQSLDNKVIRHAVRCSRTLTI